jgi:hypothetical protein
VSCWALFSRLHPACMRDGECSGGAAPQTVHGVAWQGCAGPRNAYAACQANMLKMHACVVRFPRFPPSLLSAGAPGTCAGLPPRYRHQRGVPERSGSHYRPPGALICVLTLAAFLYCGFQQLCQHINTVSVGATVGLCLVGCQRMTWKSVAAARQFSRKESLQELGSTSATAMLCNGEGWRMLSLGTA